MDQNEAPDYIDIYFTQGDEVTIPTGLFVPSYTGSYQARQGETNSGSGPARMIFPAAFVVGSYFQSGPFSAAGTVSGRGVNTQDNLGISTLNSLGATLVNKALIIEKLEAYLGGGDYNTIGIDGTRTPPVAPITYGVVTANGIGDFSTVGGILNNNTGGSITFDSGAARGPQYYADCNFIFGPGSNLVLFGDAQTSIMGSGPGAWFCLRMKVKKVISAIEALLYNCPDAGPKMYEDLNAKYQPRATFSGKSGEPLTALTTDDINRIYGIFIPKQ